jgi:MFS family permease
MEGSIQGADRIETDIPARLDRLPWSRFHLLVVLALGVTWVLDGLEVTIVGSLGPVLQDKSTLGLTAAEVGSIASVYVAGAVAGALFFGWLTDRNGRKLIFNLTLGIYVAGVLLSALAWNEWSFAVFRLITGFGIGGEYAAINSAIDELMPARLRGCIDLMVNGSYWAGAALGAAAAIVLVSGAVVPLAWGWRLGFGIGGVLGVGVLFLRHFVPESPRWLVTHGYDAAARANIEDLERRVSGSGGGALAPTDRTLTVHPRPAFGFGVVFGVMLGKHRGRSVLALTLMVAQAFLFNAVFFTYGLVLQRFERVPSADIGYYILPLCAGSLVGPFALGHLFDTVGRKVMISLTYGATGVLLIAMAVLFGMGLLDALTQTACWIGIFFFASAAASSAYLTASEIFPLEIRALAIAVFYALGTAIGGVAAPWLFGHLIGSGSAWALSGGYCVAGALMLVGAGMELWLGVSAEGKSLEDIAEPLSA